MLGIIVSLPRELKTLTLEKIPIGTTKAISAHTLVALSGIGPERAYAAGALLVSTGATALLSWGFAAALDDHLNAGCLLLPERIISATGENYQVSVQWHRHLYHLLETRHSVRTDALVESEAIVKTSMEKRALARRTQAAATDMESAAHARLAKERRLPFVAVRAIIDRASTDIPDTVLTALNPHGDINAWKLFTNIYLRPSDWIKIIRLGFQFNAARASLTKIHELVLALPEL
jgi:adenosylhomocysteine nucleosidase